MSGLEVAASIVGIAGFGTKLAKDVYVFGQTFASAPERLQRVGEDINVTKAILSELAEVVKENGEHITTDGYAVISQATRQYEEIFASLDKALERVRGSDPSEAASEAVDRSLAWHKRSLWIFREAAVEQYRVDLLHAKMNVQAAFIVQNSRANRRDAILAMKELLREHLPDLQGSDIGDISSVARELGFFPASSSDVISSRRAQSRDLPSPLVAFDNGDYQDGQCNDGQSGPTSNTPANFLESMSRTTAVAPFRYQVPQPQTSLRDRGWSRVALSSPQPSARPSPSDAKSLGETPQDSKPGIIRSLRSRFFFPYKIAVVPRTRRSAAHLGQHSPQGAALDEINDTTPFRPLATLNHFSSREDVEAILAVAQKHDDGEGRRRYQRATLKRKACDGHAERHAEDNAENMLQRLAERWIAPHINEDERTQ